MFVMSTTVVKEEHIIKLREQSLQYINAILQLYYHVAIIPVSLSIYTILKFLEKRGCC